MVQGSGRSAVALLAAGLVGVAVVPPATAGAATITACVKSKTGDVRIRSGAAAKKKCAKGWKRVRWSTSGPAGKQGLPGAAGALGLPGAAGTQGPAGPAFTVRDATGATVGQYMGLVANGIPFYSVLREGGFYYYLGSGQAYPLGSPDWKLNDCTGTAYSKGVANLNAASLSLLFAGPFRMIFRTVSTTGTFGPTSAWKGRGTTEAITATQLYRRNGTTGVCETDNSPYTGDIAPLDPISAPPDFTGPLSIG